MNLDGSIHLVMEDQTMKGLAPGIMSLFFTGYLYMQAYNVVMVDLKHMQNLMDGATAQLAIANAGGDLVKTHTVVF